MKIQVSGKTYFGVLDPRATDVPKEEGWPTPTFARRGRGTTATYDLTREQAEVMADHLRDMAECRLTGSDDVDDHAEGRACAKDALRIQTALSS